MKTDWTPEALADFRITDLVETLKLIGDSKEQQHLSIRAAVVRELKTRSSADLVRYILKTLK